MANAIVSKKKKFLLFKLHEHTYLITFNVTLYWEYIFNVLDKVCGKIKEKKVLLPFITSHCKYLINIHICPHYHYLHLHFLVHYKYEIYIIRILIYFYMF